MIFSFRSSSQLVQQNINYLRKNKKHTKRIYYKFLLSGRGLAWQQEIWLVLAKAPLFHH